MLDHAIQLSKIIARADCKKENETVMVSDTSQKSCTHSAPV